MAIDNEGNPPLHFAVKHSDSEMIDLLLASGADLSHRNFTGKEAVDFGITAANQEDLLLSLLERGGNMQISAGDSALHKAVRNGWVTIVQYLLRNGADINVKNKSMSTLLHTAINYSIGKNTKMIEYLLTNGIQLEEKDKNGFTPLYLAIFRGSYEIVKLLLENGANTESTWLAGLTPLQYIAKKDARLAKLLIRYGANVKVYDVSTKQNLLHIAAQSGDVELIRMLLKSSLDPNQKDILSKLPVDYAKQYGHVGAEKLLRFVP